MLNRSLFFGVCIVLFFTGMGAALASYLTGIFDTPCAWSSQGYIANVSTEGKGHAVLVCTMDNAHCNTAKHGGRPTEWEVKGGTIFIDWSASCRADSIYKR